MRISGILREVKANRYFVSKSEAATGRLIRKRDKVRDKRGQVMNIYVGNLSLETTEDELREEFIKFGEVISVTVMNDRYIGSGQPKGYGFVEMTSKSEGQVAIASLKGKRLRERVIDVIEALPFSDKRGIESPQSEEANILNRNRKVRQRRY